MKYIFFSLSVILLITACSSKKPNTRTYEQKQMEQKAFSDLDKELHK
jgi:outer membrane biogenesis lipoprotein LolB